MGQINMKPAVGFLFAGVITGAVVALLYTPQSGIRTKKDIKKFARKSVDRRDDLQREIRNQVADWVDEMTEVVKDGIDHGKKVSAEGYEQVLQGFDNAKKCVEDGKSQIEKWIKTA